MDAENKGILYGVGVGPGDPELITIKAARLINENRYIAIPGADKDETISYKIAEPIIDNPKEKIIISCDVKMTRDKDALYDSYKEAAEKIISVLDRSENVVYLTIGDPTIYASYMNIHRLVEDKGYKAEMINGIPSFCAAAARLDISLCDRSSQLHIIPSSYDIGDAFEQKGVKVLMKSAGRLSEVKARLKENKALAYMVENCCMEDEKLYRSVDEIDEKAGYLSIIIVKDELQ